MAWLWSWDFQAGATSKELIKPKWRSIKMDGRDGTGTFVKGTYKNVPVYDYKGHVSNRMNYINYGYAAYVQGNHKARNPNQIYCSMLCRTAVSLKISRQWIRTK